MTDLNFLALIPSLDTEHGRMLLADGECGALPPKVYHWPERRWSDQCGEWHHYPIIGGKTALPLVFNGKPCPEGIERAERVLKAIVGAPDCSEVYADGENGLNIVVRTRSGLTVLWTYLCSDKSPLESLALALQAKGAAEVVRG